MLEERGICPGANFISSCIENTKNNQAFDNFDGNETDNEGESCFYGGMASEDVEGMLRPLGRRAEDVTAAEIQNAIIHALLKCPNQSCTMHSLTSRVLKEVGVLTRGNPRKVFERRVIRALNILDEQGVVQKYKAKNDRVRLINKIIGLTNRSTLYVKDKDVG